MSALDMCQKVHCVRRLMPNVGDKSLSNRKGLLGD